MLLFEELSKISDVVGQLLRGDDYPNKIEPIQLKQAVLSYPLRGGKRIRPAILMWCCGLLEGNPDQAKYAAAAAEVYHNWTLVHDDIIDQDEMRRGKPATHTELSKFALDLFKTNDLKSKKFGMDFGILAGDLQHAWAINLLMKSIDLGVSYEVVHHLCRDLCEILSRELISGEALDVEFSYKPIEKVKPNEVERMMYLKTSALLNFCSCSGAKIALKAVDNSDKRIKKLSDFTSAMGIAFQLRDDWLGIFGDAESFGKPIGSDICSAKPTILILDTINRLNEKDKSVLLSYIGIDSISEKDIEIIQNLIRKSGAEENILNQTEQLKFLALNSISGFPENKYKKLLLELNDYLVNRDK